MREIRLSRLDERIRPLAARLILEATGLHISLMVINTLRTAEEHALDIANKVSWTNNSLHLPQPPSGLALAIDVCPVSYLTVKNWNPLGENWLKIGELGESIGLTWGGRWKERDLSHFQLDVARELKNA